MIGVDPTNGNPLPTDAEVAYSINKLRAHAKKNKVKEAKQLGEHVSVIEFQLTVNADRSAYSLTQEIAAALNLQIDAKEPVESVRAISGWTGNIEELKK